MVLNDAEIVRRAATAQLISGHLAENVVNCGCLLRAGTAFQPETGHELVVGSGTTGRSWGWRRGTRTLATSWEIGPSEMLIVMTCESVKIPDDLCASFAPLHRLAKRGVMLLNPAIIEPGYEGRLSCFLVNFSSNRVRVTPEDAVAKILFHRLESRPASLRPLVIPDASYRSELASNAAGLHRTFLDVTGIENRAVRKAQQAAKRAALIGGVAIAVLLLWAQVEPLVTHWIWERTGMATVSRRTTDAVLLRDIEHAREKLVLEAELLELQRRSSAMEKEIQDLKGSSSGRE